MELEEIVTFMILMVVFSAMIVSISLNNTNLINKNPSHSTKLHMENILIHSIKKLKTNLFNYVSDGSGRDFYVASTEGGNSDPYKWRN